MLASKENCQLAQQLLEREGFLLLDNTHAFITEFLEACYARLPRQATLIASKQRKKKVKENKITPTKWNPITREYEQIIEEDNPTRLLHD